MAKTQQRRFLIGSKNRNGGLSGEFVEGMICCPGGKDVCLDQQGNTTQYARAHTVDGGPVVELLGGASVARHCRRMTGRLRTRRLFDGWMRYRGVGKAGGRGGCLRDGGRPARWRVGRCIRKRWRRCTCTRLTRRTSASLAPSFSPVSRKAAHSMYSARGGEAPLRLEG